MVNLQERLNSANVDPTTPELRSADIVISPSSQDAETMVMSAINTQLQPVGDENDHVGLYGPLASGSSTFFLPLTPLRPPGSGARHTVHERRSPPSYLFS
jgi:hypothetical protein